MNICKYPYLIFFFVFLSLFHLNPGSKCSIKPDPALTQEQAVFVSMNCDHTQILLNAKSRPLISSMGWRQPVPLPHTYL